MSLALILVCIALLLATGAGAVVVRRDATRLVYRASLALTSLVLIVAAAHLVSWGGAATIVLPLGLPWIGAHFRLDALAAFFLVVVNLGGAAASAYGLGYGQHEPAPERVLPFFPAFLAGMNLVVVAADAFAFLLAWEFMSLSSTTPMPATSIS
jgi:formate hydrogenlyase subunit 3/multisubunit Na+/H+ antiporter MnhD subunit